MPTPIIGIEGMTQVILGYRTAFPDIHFTVEAQVAENDLVTTRWVATGTNTGSLMGMPATGKAATVTGISLNRFVKDKTVELWASVDMMGMMQQLGVIPAPSH
jgi:predicted ester cyclase